MIITITGTPGTGKTYISKRIAKATGMEYFDLNKYIKDHKLYDSYNNEDKTYDVDVKKLGKLNALFKKYRSKNPLPNELIGKKIDVKKLLSVLKNKKISGVVIDSHLSHNLKSDYCIVVKSDIKNISKRLRLRKYPEKKVRDNIESEIFDICLEEAKILKRKIIVVDN